MRYLCLLVTLVTLAGCSTDHAASSQVSAGIEPMDAATASMGQYCQDHYGDPLGASHQADATEVSAYNNADGHLIAANCEVDGSMLSDAALRTSFFYDRRRRRATPTDRWYRITLCKEWDPTRSSEICSRKKQRTSGAAHWRSASNETLAT